jgi:hypothetical protein
MKNDLSRGDEVYSLEVFLVLVEYEVSRSIRYPTPVGLIEIEMTPTGLDEKSLRAASKTFTSALNSHLRSVDIPCGQGRNFKILLPTANEAGIRSVCERLLSVFRNKFNTPEGGSLAFSVNLGAVSHPGGDTLSREYLLAQAAEALRLAKLKGPNTFTLIT